MDSHFTIPKRSSLWLRRSLNAKSSGKLVDRVTIIICLIIALAAFWVFRLFVATIGIDNGFLTPPTALSTGLSAILGIGKASVARGLFIGSFILLNIGIYLLVREMTKRQMPSILAAITYLVPLIPVVILSGGDVTFAKSFFAMIYGDGSRLLAIALFPFSIIFFLRYLKQARVVDLLAVVTLSSISVWTDYLQIWSLVLILAIVAITDFFLGETKLKLKRFAIVLFFLGTTTLFLYSPLFWFKNIGLLADTAVNLKFLFPLPTILASLLFLFSFVFFAKREDRQQIFVSLLTFAFFFFVVFYWLSFKKTVVPYPHRLIPDLFIFGTISLSLAISAFVDKLALKEKLNFYNWGFWKLFGYLAFGVVSFFILSVGAYLFSPLAVDAFDGSGGVFARVSAESLTEKQLALGVGDDGVNLANGHLDILILLAILAIAAFLFYLNFMRDISGRKQTSDN